MRLKWKLSVLAAFSWLNLLHTTNVFAQSAGGVGGGGGNLVPSTPQDIKDAFSNAAERGVFFILMKFFDGYDRPLKPVTIIQEQNLRHILMRMTPGAVQFDLRRSKLIFKNGPCQSRVGLEQASVEANRPGTPICISLTLLSRVPKADLKTNAINLLIREVSHHFGADEALADKVQAFYSGWILRANPLFAALDMIEHQLNAIVYILRSIPSSRDEELCGELGYLSGEASAYRILMFNLSNGTSARIIDSGIPDEEGLMVDIQELSDKWMPFCGNDSWSSPAFGSGYDVHKELPAVRKGDRVGLSTALQAYAVLLRQQRDKFPVQMGY